MHYWSLTRTYLAVNIERFRLIGFDWVNSTGPLASFEHITAIHWKVCAANTQLMVLVLLKQQFKLSIDFMLFLPFISVVPLVELIVRYRKGSGVSGFKSKGLSAVS